MVELCNKIESDKNSLAVGYTDFKISYILREQNRISDSLTKTSYKVFLEIFVLLIVNTIPILLPRPFE